MQWRPINHLFDNHTLCNPSWCHKRKQLDKGESGNNNRPPVNPKNEHDSKTYYCSKVSNKRLYEAMEKSMQLTLQRSTYFNASIHSILKSTKD